MQKAWLWVSCSIVAILLVTFPITYNKIHPVSEFNEPMPTHHEETLTSSSEAANTTYATATDILNDVWIQQDHMLRTSGTGGGGGGYAILGTPLADQLAVWVDSVTLKGTKTLVSPVDFTAITAPATPIAGQSSVYVDSTSKKLCSKDDAGVVSCVGAAASGITTLDGQTGPTVNITRGAGIGGSSSGNTITLSTASSEADFLTSGALSCGAATQGRMQVHSTPLQYCDNAPTPALQYAAYGDNLGRALTGDSATAFFPTGQLEAARGGTNADSSASTGLAHVNAGAWSWTSVLTADITDAQITYPKIQNVTTARLLGRNTAGSGVMEELTAGTVKTMLALNNVDNTADVNKTVGAAVAASTNPANCPVAGTFPNGVDANWVPENCVTLSSVNAQTTTYQVLAADFDRYKTITVASGTFTITLVDVATQPADGKSIDVINYGSGVVTINRSNQNINGGAISLSLAAGSAAAPTGAHIVSNGANYFAALFGGTGGGGGSGTVGAGSDTNVARYNGSGTVVGPSSGISLSTTTILTKRNAVAGISTNVTLGNHNIITCTSGSSTITATLPAANATLVGEYTVIKIDAGIGECDIARAGTDTINGLAGNVRLLKQWDSAVIQLVDVGSPGNWYAISAKSQLGYYQFPMQTVKLPTSNAAIIAQDEPRTKLLFDPTASWCGSWTLQLNPDFGTAPTILYTYAMTSATSQSAMMDWSVWKTSNNEAADGQVESYDTANTCTDANVPSTAGVIRQISCPLTNFDSAIANDLITIKACRNIADNATGNLELMGAQLQYVKQ